MVMLHFRTFTLSFNFVSFLVLASAEALHAEKTFVINFKSLIDRSLETLSLWQVLNEHNVEDVILHLDTVRLFFQFCKLK